MALLVGILTVLTRRPDLGVWLLRFMLFDKPQWDVKVEIPFPPNEQTMRRLNTNRPGRASQNENLIRINALQFRDSVKRF